METLAFVQGVLTVIGLLMVGGMVWAVLKINDIKDSLEGLYQEVNETQTQLHLRIDKEIQDVDSKMDDLSRQVENNSENIYRTIDSRLDKLQSKFTNN
jgi:peptidoglycan hydrolase CwlO-like protein